MNDIVMLLFSIKIMANDWQIVVTIVGHIIILYYLKSKLCTVPSIQTL